MVVVNQGCHGKSTHNEQSDYTCTVNYSTFNSISTPVRGQIKVKNWVYMVVIPQAITSYCPVDID